MGVHGAVVGLVLGLAGGSAVMAAEQSLTIRNGVLEVRYQAGSGRFALRARGREFATDGALNGTGGAAKVVSVTDRVFGAGQAIAVSYPNGGADQVLLFPRLPFALFRSRLHNGGAETCVLPKARPVSVTVALGKPETLRVLGTGGLAAPGQAPGSYMWLAVAEPQSRNGVVGGWITTDRGSGAVFPSVRDGKVRLDAQVDYGRLRIAPGKDETLETFALGYFDDARLGLEAWADAVAQVYDIHLPPQPTVYCTWYHAGASNEKDLAAQAEFARRELAPFGFSVMQIDDGWQEGDSKGNGPRKNFTTHRASGPYPSGMKATADGLRADGFTPGLWFMPFAGTFNDPWFETHSDWFVKREDGKPYDLSWGGTCLDMTHPGAREYLRGIAGRIAHEWGYRYFKMDGLWTGSATEMGYINDAYKDDKIGNALFANPEKTNIEAFRDGLRLVREAAGKDVFFLGCCAPQNMRSYGGAFGLLDAMRIGPDNGPSWHGLVTGPTYGSRNYFLHGRVWYNDPDPLYVRPSLPLEQSRLICSWVTLSGQLNASSDAFASLPPERLDLLKRTMPAHGLPARPVDLFEEKVPCVWLLSDERKTPRRDVIGLFNWESKERAFDTPLAHLGLPGKGEYLAFDYWANGLVMPFKGRLGLTVPPQSCRVLAVRPLLERPQLLSTSRHITQGIVDVLEEQWDGRARALSGVSKVVGGDPYELRLATHSTRGLWKVSAAELSPEDRAAGVTLALKEEPGLARVVVRSATSREVRWRVRFEARQAPEAAPGAVTDLKAEMPDPFGPLVLSWKGQAPFYEVRRGEAVIAAGLGGFSYRDSAAAPGESYRYAVVPISFGGKRGEAMALTFRAPIVEPGPVPPLPQVSLMTLKPESARTGWGSVGVGKSAAGLPLTLGKETYRDGIGLHANAEAVYACRKEWKRFVAVVGIDEAQRWQNQSSLTCEVYAEVAKERRLLGRSPILRFGKLERWHFDLPLPANCRQVRLVVTDAGDGNKSDHADWVNAGFLP